MYLLFQILAIDAIKRITIFARKYIHCQKIERKTVDFALGVNFFLYLKLPPVYTHGTIYPKNILLFNFAAFYFESGSADILCAELVVRAVSTVAKNVFFLLLLLTFSAIIKYWK